MSDFLSEDRRHNLVDALGLFGMPKDMANRMTSFTEEEADVHLAAHLAAVAMWREKLNNGADKPAKYEMFVRFDRLIIKAIMEEAKERDLDDRDFPLSHPLAAHIDATIGNPFVPQSRH